MERLKPGDIASDFEVVTAKNEVFRLSEQTGIRRTIKN